MTTLSMSPCHRSVVTLTADHHRFATAHEQATRAEVARRVAALGDWHYAGEYEPGTAFAPAPYFVPSDTLVAGAQTEGLGIENAADLFGGVVPEAFVAGKTITHALVDTASDRPAGWRTDFAARVAPAVLAGRSAFAVADARRAGLGLLENGPVRIKPAAATGGRGQTVAHDADMLRRGLDAIDPAAIAQHGLVLEENLQDPVTVSVGQVTVGNLVASYHGLQRLTSNHRGESVYGGSDLTLVRGDFDVLLALPLAASLRLAIEQARHFHRCVTECFAGFYASRINYDVAQGTRASGAWRSGVLEQSWRIGGATGAELAALELFREQPDCQRVQAACHEAYGAAAAPEGASVYFQGVDPRVGPLVKYTVVTAHADAP